MAPFQPYSGVLVLPRTMAPGGLEALDRGRVLGGYVVLIQARTPGGSDSLGDDDVLDRYRDSVQWAKAVAALDGCLGGPGLLPGGVECRSAKGVELGVDLFDTIDEGID